LAEIQYLFELGKTAGARVSFQKFLARNVPIPNQVLNDFFELFSHGFSMRRAYEQDHS
jgi:hypothetical protein